MLENITASFQSVWAHKVRSFLTMLGIIIGIASIITIVSTIKGTNDQIKQNLIGSGVNAVVVSLYQGDQPVDLQYSAVPEAVTPITEETRQALTALDGVVEASVFYSRSYADGVYYREMSYNGALYGVDEHYLALYGYRLTGGRGFLPSDFSDRRRVALLDSNARDTLFAGQNPVGKVLEIQGEPYTVVGITEQSDSFTPVIQSMEDYTLYMNTGSGRIFIPDSTWPMVYRFDEPQTVAVGTASTDEMTQVGKRAEELITDAHVTGDEYVYRSQDLMEQARKLQELSGATNMQLLWIAGISLLVGGIGVMNIMLVTVTERTREIGLKKALGAKRKKILAQFLTEAAVLTSLGGILGVATGIGLAKLLATLMQMPTAISIPAILVAVVFSMAIGILFGLIPAVKAARLNPIEALRRE